MTFTIHSQAKMGIRVNMEVSVKGSLLLKLKAAGLWEL
jgi:hypothetical protein